MKTACRCSIEQKERQQTDRDRDTQLYTHTHIHTYIQTYMHTTLLEWLLRSCIAKRDLEKREKEGKERKKKEKTNISRPRTVNSHSRSLKKERERGREGKGKTKISRKELANDGDFVLFLHRPFTAGQFIQVYIHIYTSISSVATDAPSQHPSSWAGRSIPWGGGRWWFERGAELDYGRLNCTTRALFCLPSSGVLIHRARAFKVSKPRKLYCRTWALGADRGDTV